MTGNKGDDKEQQNSFKKLVNKAVGDPSKINWEEMTHELFTTPSKTKEKHGNQYNIYDFSKDTDRNDVDIDPEESSNKSDPPQP